MTDRAGGARTTDLPSAPGQPRTAVALGGGGARGYAHIGVLEVLAERGYDVVSVAGSSMGALIGGLYAAGGLREYRDWALGLAQRDVWRLLDVSPRAPGAIRAEKIVAVVADLLGDTRIEDLPLDFTAVATDLMAGEERWFRDGPLTAAIRASIALPGFMTPVVIGGRLLADGGLMNPLPIAPTVAARADVTVAVAVSGRHPPPDAGTAASFRPRRPDRTRRLRPTATHMLDADVLRGLGTRVAALRRAAPGQRADPPVPEDAPEALFEELPPGLRTLDVMELSFAALRAAVMRHTLTDAPPDLLVTVPGSSCRTLDFHRAEEMIGLGRRLATEALDGWDGRPTTREPGTVSAS